MTLANKSFKQRKTQNVQTQLYNKNVKNFFILSNCSDSSTEHSSLGAGQCSLDGLLTGHKSEWNSQRHLSTIHQYYNHVINHMTAAKTQSALLPHSSTTYSSPCFMILSHQLAYVQCYGQQTTPLPSYAVTFPFLHQYQITLLADKRHGG